ncbi:MAG: hypothetical protein FJ086_20475, partial [Deltaproteobacteria bacterium]|nr:hypothetical protein [Deltaproteobacteria bacterium]
MELGNSGWLLALVEAAVAAHDAATPDLLAPPAATARARARGYLRQVVRDSGLSYGTPTGVAPAPADGSTRPAEEELYLAVLRTLARMALDVSVLVGAPPGPRREQL